ncbi:MAG: alpha/beta hydrolase [Gemmatimonadota bacterium]
MAVRDVGSGPPVLLIHGIPGSAAVWEGVATGLAARGFRALAPDLLGFGASERPKGVEPIWIDAQAAALATYLDSVRCGPAIVVGHDYGVPITVTLATRYPQLVKAVALAAGNLFPDTPIPAPLRGVTVPVLGPVLSRVVMSGPSLRMMLRVGSGRPRPSLDPGIYTGDADQVDAIGRIFSAALRELGPRYAPVAQALPGLSVPRVVLWGDRDPFFPLDQGLRAARALGVELTRAPGAGHFLPAERPGLFLDAVQDLHEQARRGAPSQHVRALGTPANGTWPPL